jgi:hypothetical protein
VPARRSVPPSQSSPSPSASTISFRSARCNRYQREDSAWANECATSVDDHAKGFESKRCRILPAFIRYDVLADRAEPIRPKALPAQSLAVKEFGDDWSEPLERADLDLAAATSARSSIWRGFSTT